MNKEKIYFTLSNLGYHLEDFGREWRCAALYRDDSKNHTSLRIWKNTGKWKDFGTGEWGDFPKLVKLTLGLNDDQVKVWLEKEKIDAVTSRIETRSQNEEIKCGRFFNIDFDFRIDHSYWLGRGVSLETLTMFRGMLCIDQKHKLRGRYVFPIYDPSARYVLGFSARDVVHPTPYIKWKHLGEIEDWQYPLFLSHEYIEESRTVILVESIGDALKLWSAGYRYVLVNFGINIRPAILSTLISLNPSRIIVSFNNDFKNGDENNGAKAAWKTRQELLNYFGVREVCIKLPTANNDWGEMSIPQIQSEFNQFLKS